MPYVIIRNNLCLNLYVVKFYRHIGSQHNWWLFVRSRSIVEGGVEYDTSKYFDFKQVLNFKVRNQNKHKFEEYTLYRYNPWGATLLINWLATSKFQQHNITVTRNKYGFECSVNALSLLKKNTRRMNVFCCFKCRLDQKYTRG